jgi:hypothetical protein
VAAPPPIGWVQLRSTDPTIFLQVRLGDKEPLVTAGYGGWSEIARPRKRPISFWLGAPGLRMTLPIIFDGFRDGRSVERDIAKLERLATATAANGQPPVLTLVARGGAVPNQDKLWVVDSLGWQSGQTMNASGARTRAICDVALFEFIEDARLVERSPSKRIRALSKQKQSKRGGKSKRVVAKRAKTVVHKSTRVDLDTDFGTGEDLLTIAARELGDCTRWVEIAQLNGLRDPRAITPGQVLRMP